MIPHLFHQTWSSRELPGRLAEFGESWRRHNPGFLHRFYDDADCAAFVEREFPERLAAYRALPTAVQRADLFRYMILFREGGLYADVDMECLQPVLPLLQTSGAVLGIETGLTRQRQLELGYDEPFQIANCIMAAEPGHPFFGHLIRTITEKGIVQGGTVEAVEDSTGPRMLTREFFRLRPGAVTVLAQICWAPPLWFPTRFPIGMNMYARHHNLGSWKPKRRVGWARRLVERSSVPSPFPRLLHVETTARSVDPRTASHEPPP